MKTAGLGLFLSVCSFAAVADEAARSIDVHGAQVEAIEISNFNDSSLVHSFKVTKPTPIPFANGNSFVATDTVFLNRAGTVSSIQTPKGELIRWTLSDGRVLSLNCKPKSGPSGEIARMVRFHENKQYQDGCSTTEGVGFSDALGSNGQAIGDIEFSADGKIVYASKVAWGSLILGKSKVQLFPTSEVAFHPNGRPRFFTLTHGESFKAQDPTYGELAFIQKEGKHAVTQLLDDGRVERGIIGQDLKHAETGLPVAKGSGVVFSDVQGKSVLVLINFLEPVKIKAGKYELVVKQFHMDAERKLYGVVLSEGFFFQIPDQGKTIWVPEGSLVGMDQNWNIGLIREPNKNRN